MLKRIRLTDFKSFVDEEVELAPLTFLVGANASGKSNFLDALQFLRATEFFLPLAEVLNGEDRSTPDAWPGIRGRASEAARSGTTSFAIETTWNAKGPSQDNGEFEEEQLELNHRLTCRTTPDPILESESLSDAHGKVLFTGKLLNDRFQLSWEETQAERMVSVPDRSFIHMFRSELFRPAFDMNPPRQANVAVRAPIYATLLLDALKRLRFISMQSGGMRGYGKRSHGLGDDGKNISGVLAALCEDPQEKLSIVNWLAGLCAPEFADIDFIEVKELRDVMAVLVEKTGTRVTIRSASDGTLRFLGMLLALRTAEPGSVILMEDIETGLHPTRIRLLVEYLQAVARERKLQIIATTHSPTVLEWLDDETLRSVIVFGRVPEQKGTLMRRLGDLPHFPEVVERKGIEELFTTGWLEMAL